MTQPQEPLPEEILNLRTPIHRCFSSNNNTTDSTTTKVVSIFDHIRKHLKGGKPVEKLALQMLGEDTIKENMKAFDELKLAVEMYLEMIAINKAKMRKIAAAHQSDSSKNKVTPTPTPTPPPPPPVGSVAAHSASPLTSKLLHQNNDIGGRRPHQKNEEQQSTTAATTTTTTLEATLENLLANLEKEDSKNRSIVELLNDFDFLKATLAPQLQPLLIKEHSALLADAEDVRRFIAKPVNISSSTESSVSYYHSYYSCSSSATSPAPTSRPPSSTITTSTSVASTTSCRPSSAVVASKYYSTSSVLSSSSSLSLSNHLPQLQQSQTTRPDSDLSTSTYSSSHGGGGGGSSLTAREKSTNINKNNSSDYSRVIPISEMTTSRVRSVLMARMHRSGDEDPSEEVTGQAETMEKSNNEKKKIVFGIEVSDDDEDDGIDDDEDMGGLF